MGLMAEPILKIQAVEDDPDIQIILRMVLTKLGHAEVTIVGEGRQVVPVAKSYAPGLILLDVMLPDMSGFEIIKELKADPACKDIPIIFLTARSMPAEIEEMKNLGALGYLAKPFDPMSLIEQINDFLRPLEKSIGG